MAVSKIEQVLYPPKDLHIPFNMSEAGRKIKRNCERFGLETSTYISILWLQQFHYLLLSMQSRWCIGFSWLLNPKVIPSKCISVLQSPQSFNLSFSRKKQDTVVTSSVFHAIHFLKNQRNQRIKKRDILQNQAPCQKAFTQRVSTLVKWQEFNRFWLP